VPVITLASAAETAVIDKNTDVTSEISGGKREKYYY